MNVSARDTSNRFRRRDVERSCWRRETASGVGLAGLLAQRAITRMSLVQSRDLVELRRTFGQRRDALVANATCDSTQRPIAGGRRLQYDRPMSNRQTLAREIRALLGRDPPAFIPALEKAVRLAVLVDSPEHKMLFEFHLAGIDKNLSEESLRVAKWPDRLRKRRWDPFNAFKADRDMGDGRLLTLEFSAIEFLMQTATEAKESVQPGGPEYAQILDALRTLIPIRSRVRQRLSLFVNDILDADDGQEVTAENGTEPVHSAPAEEDQGSEGDTLTLGLICPSAPASWWKLRKIDLLSRCQ